MLRSVYGKLSAVVLLLFYLVGTISIVLTILSNRLYYQEMSQGVSRALAKRLVQKKELMPGGAVGRESFRELAAELETISPSVSLYLLDPDGRILISSRPEAELVTDRVSMEPLQRMLRGGGGLPIFGANPRRQGATGIFSVCPVPLEGEAQAYLYAVIDDRAGGEAGALRDGSNIVRLSLLVFFAGVVLFTLVALLVFRLLTRRVRRLAGAVEEFERQGLVGSSSFPVGKGEGGDEIDRLGSAFSSMAGRISSQMETIRRDDALRRELITNVSHDLRTPLTSLQGYLETLKLKEDLSPGERREYLDTALRQSDRLRRLVFELFELAKLDSGETEVRKEPFSPGELVQDVTQKFLLSAQKQGIALAADIAKDIPVISADIGLVERALENLIRNALQFTLREGTIKVSLFSRDGPVLFAVRDSGTGIPPEELPRIFERSFRQRPPAGKADEGAGLGLAITKRIAELHGGSVTVESVPGEGALFTLAIPRG